jgi:beta-galactosidase
MVPPEADLSRYKLVLAPTAMLASAELAAALTRFVRNGGTLLLGVRSGFKTASNLVIDQPLPGLLRGLVGATVTDWAALPPGVSFDLEASNPDLNGRVAVWVESLAVEAGQGAEVLARYATGPFAGQAALTENKVGAGRALYLGWYPAEEQALALVTRLTAQAGVSRPVEALPAGVIAAQRGAHTILLNFTDQALPVRVHGQALVLPPRAVKVWP